MTFHRPARLTLALAAALALTGLACDATEGTADVDAAAQATPAAALPADLVLSSPPEGATDVAGLRANAAEGERVVVRGVVGGRADPVADNRALFTLLDPSMQTCDKMEGDGCATPWDACCEPADAIAANSATVQVVGDDGRPLRSGLGGVGGLAPLKEVVVVGTYRPSPDGKALAIDATGLYVQP